MSRLEIKESNNSGVSYHPCYVCNDVIKLEIDKYCYKKFEDGIKYRHFWHGVPGITRAIGGGGGFNGYAKTLEQAKQRAEYYLHNNPYAAPEVKEGEQLVLDEVNRLEELDKESN